MTINERTLQQLLEAGEAGTVEFKMKAPRPSELAERICGMANTRSGGTILFGIEDSTGRAVGLAHPNETIDAILRAARLVKPHVTFIGEGQATVMIGDMQVIVVQIAPNVGPLYQASGVFWVRKGSHTIPMSMEEVENHLNSYGSTRWETKLCPRAFLDDSDLDRVQRHLAYRDERSGASSLDRG
jgi:predicted HTH transcriptional regulator